MKRIITIQHPQSEQHVNRMIGSWGNWDLTENGVIQAHSIGKHLFTEIGSDKYSIYSSDLLRAKHTAEIISSYLNINPIYDNRLREFDLGKAVGHSKKWAKENLCCPVWADTIDWADTADGRVFCGAESRREVWHRVSCFVDTVLAQSCDNFILVSHSGTLSVLFSIWLGMDLEALNKHTFWGESGGVSFLREDTDGRHIISRLSDMSYIKE